MFSLPARDMGVAASHRWHGRLQALGGRLALAVACVLWSATAAFAQPVCGPAVLSARVLLQGAMTLTPLRLALDTSGGAALMGDELRVGQAGTSFIPLAQPYSALNAAARYQFVGTSGAETIAAPVRTVTGPNAIVDWVFMELRDAADNTQIVATRAALVQRDGDIVDTDGVSGVTFNITAGNYFVAVRHRNHLGVMTAAAVTVTGGMGLLDFSSAATPLYLNPAVPSIAGSQTAALGDGRRALWGGDANLAASGQDQLSLVRHKVKYNGGGNDTDVVNGQVQVAPGNGAFSSDFDQAFGYRTADVTMDGRTQYTPLGAPAALVGDECGNLLGANGAAVDDTRLICNTVLNFPANLARNPAYDFVLEALPSTRVLAPPALPGIVACVPGVGGGPSPIPTLNDAMLAALSLMLMALAATRPTLRRRR